MNNREPKVMKRHKRNLLLLLVALSVALNVAFLGVWLMHVVRGGHERRSTPATEKGTGEIWCPLHRKLGVSAEQWATIEPRLREFRAAARGMREQVNEHRRELIGLLAIDEPDLAAIRAKQAEIQAGQRRMQKLVVDYLLAEKDVLTAEQQRELFSMMRRRAECAGRPALFQGRRPDGGTCSDDGPAEGSK